jgi:hypothetical protein
VNEARCSHCEERPAVCVGAYERMEALELACDVCCGHGCEDGFCVQIDDALDDGPHYHIPDDRLVAVRAFLEEHFGAGGDS